MRIARYIANFGRYSRRQASRLIASEAVFINGNLANHSDRVGHQDSIVIQGIRLQPYFEKVYFIYYKPVGIDCNCSLDNKQSILHVMPLGYPRLFPVGRLDKDSEGLLLVTNDAGFCQRLLHPENKVKKVYRVTVDKPIDDQLAINLEQGVRLNTWLAKAYRAQKVAENELRITLLEGKNRQIRRMCKALGYRVVKLKRIQIGDIALGELQPGEWREQTKMLDRFTQ